MSQSLSDRIVVGAALNPFDHAVLAAAIAEAQRRVVTLHVVHALEISAEDLQHAQAAVIAERRARRNAQRDAAHTTLQQTMLRLAATTAPNMPVTYQIEPGDPATLLLGAARSAVLVVAGVRSGGRGSPLLLGTVSQDVAVHAPCPILLVPPPAQQ